MDSDTGFLGLTAFGALYLPVMIGAVTLLLLYGIIRVAVARGLRDHQLWMEKNRPATFEPPTERLTPRH